MRRTARFVVAVLVIVVFPRPATAQTVDGLPGRETREVIRDSPVYITADLVARAADHIERGHARFRSPALG